MIGNGQEVRSALGSSTAPSRATWNPSASNARTTRLLGASTGNFAIRRQLAWFLQGLFVRTPLPDDNTLNAKRIANVTIWVLLNDDFDSL
jgi:hypothetical protein